MLSEIEFAGTESVVTAVHPFSELGFGVADAVAAAFVREREAVDVAFAGELEVVFAWPFGA